MCIRDRIKCLWSRKNLFFLLQPSSLMRFLSVPSEEWAGLFSRAGSFRILWFSGDFLCPNLIFIFFRSTMLYFQSVRIHTRRDSRRKSLSLTIGARRYPSGWNPGISCLRSGNWRRRNYTFLRWSCSSYFRSTRAKAAANGGKNKVCIWKIFITVYSSRSLFPSSNFAEKMSK